MLKGAEDNAKVNEALTSALLSFRCSQDADIENFLRNKAIDFEKRRLCRVYLFFNRELFYQKKLKIEGYFTLSTKSMGDTSKISKNKKKKISGKPDPDTLSFVLIGQLGKYIEERDEGYIRSELSGKEMLDTVFEVINSIDKLIPCKTVLIECSDDPKVKKFYEDYGFSFLQVDNGHNQYTMFNK